MEVVDYAVRSEVGSLDLMKKELQQFLHVTLFFFPHNYPTFKIRFYFIFICGIRSSNGKAKPSMGLGPEAICLIKARNNYQPYHFGYEG